MRISFLGFLVFVAMACSDNGILNPPPPPEIPISQLQASPDTILVEGRRLYLTTYLWRDFQPFSPPDGKPLISLVYITAIDTTQLPESITSDAVWIVYNDQVWRSWFTNEPGGPSELKPYLIVKIAREGPKWGPNVSVDVIVRVTDGRGNSQFLRAPNQPIHMTI